MNCAIGANFYTLSTCRAEIALDAHDPQFVISGNGFRWTDVHTRCSFTIDANDGDIHTFLVDLKYLDARMRGGIMAKLYKGACQLAGFASRAGWDIDR
jgi:hypothetical protein